MKTAETEKSNVALLSLVAAFFLTLLKIIVAVLTGSLGILSEALHSALDLLATGITWFAVKLSDKPADLDHHYGHGKIENLSALVETILLLITSIWIIYKAIQRIYTGNQQIEVSIWAFAVVGMSIIIDFTRSKALMRVAKKHNSQALEADALHFSTDIWSSSVVLLGLMGAQFGWLRADSIAALVVAIIVIYVAFNLGKRSINVLLDRVPHETYLQIKALLDQTPELKHYHDLRVRASGADYFVEINVHVNSDLNLQQSHDIATLIENKIQSKILRSHVHVHIEPEDQH